MINSSENQARDSCSVTTTVQRQHFGQHPLIEVGKRLVHEGGNGRALRHLFNIGQLDGLDARRQALPPLITDHLELHRLHEFARRHLGAPGLRVRTWRRLSHQPFGHARRKGAARLRCGCYLAASAASTPMRGISSGVQLVLHQWNVGVQAGGVVLASVSTIQRRGGRRAA